MKSCGTWVSTILSMSWFQFYLSNRFQRVTINHCLSDPLPVKSGVHQGSTLGPLFFIVYINDLPTSIRHSKILNFADDAKCYKVIHNALNMASLQLDLNSLTEWSTKNQLPFNINKCTVLQFKSNSTIEPSSYSIDDHILSIQSQHRHLGIIFSANLNWSSHYEAIISKAYKTFGLLRRVFCNTVAGSIQAKKGLYISIVRSNITSLVAIFNKDIILLERVQRRATKYILSDYTSDYKTCLIKLNLLPLMYIYELLDILFLSNRSIHPTKASLYHITSLSTMHLRDLEAKNLFTFHQTTLS